MTKKITLTILTLAAQPLMLATSQADEVDFAKDILPIFEERCMECHREAYTSSTGKVKKPKGGLRMDDPKEMKEAEEGKALSAGKSADSEIYKRIILDAEDEDIMPPKGDPLTKEQAEKIKKWIDDGAKMGDWKGTKFDAEGKKIEDKK
jgi:uncharacterized membrane protein